MGMTKKKSGKKQKLDAAQEKEILRLSAELKDIYAQVQAATEDKKAKRETYKDAKSRLDALRAEQHELVGLIVEVRNGEWQPKLDLKTKAMN